MAKITAKGPGSVFNPPSAELPKKAFSKFFQPRALFIMGAAAILGLAPGVFTKNAHSGETGKTGATEIKKQDAGEKPRLLERLNEIRKQSEEYRKSMAQPPQERAKEKDGYDYYSEMIKVQIPETGRYAVVRASFGAMRRADGSEVSGNLLKVSFKDKKGRHSNVAHGLDSLAAEYKLFSGASPKYFKFLVQSGHTKDDQPFAAISIFPVESPGAELKDGAPFVSVVLVQGKALISAKPFKFE